MTDWTTCRVVRDRDGDLWLRGYDSDELWTANTNYPDIFLTTDEVLTVFGPLAPKFGYLGSQRLSFIPPAIFAIHADKIGIAELANRRGSVLLTTCPQIASGKAQEHRPSSGVYPLTLQGQEDFLDRVAHA